jgi:Spy/CpxP family protein refolding chaperone
MKHIVYIALLATAGTLFAQNTPASPDPLAGAFFPPELILMTRDTIGLTQEQQEAIRAGVQKTERRSDELKQQLERETAALSALARQDRVDDAALGAQLDRVLDVERELKHLHIGLLASIKNLLTPEQRARLREVAKDGGAQFADDMRRRLTEKVERVQALAQSWTASGRDPSAIAAVMQEKVKPLLDAGKPMEAEAELDCLLGQLNQSEK